jgi:serine/threonine-protein kinase
VDTLSPGANVGGYRIIDLLGSGGRESVYRAEPVRGGEQVVLKVLSSTLALDDEFRTRFLTQARQVAQLQHPNLIRVLDAGEADGRVFMAQQIVEGTSLRALLATERTLDVSRTLSFLGQLAAALDAVHRAGTIHGDVTPANILIADGDRVVLAGFGLNEDAGGDDGDLTVAGNFYGTLSYAAPEQVLGRVPGPEADVYSFGCILYECLTGERPLERARGADLLNALMEQGPPRVTETRPDLPPPIDSVVDRAMARDPADRFPNASAVVDAARLALLGTAADSDPEAPPQVASSGQLKLVVTSGPAEGERIHVDDQLEIGRATVGDGSLGGDIEISRRHAMVRREGGRFVLEDLGSTNGTFVDGRRLEGGHALSRGELIAVGATTLLVEAAGEPEVLPPAPPPPAPIVVESEPVAMPSPLPEPRPEPEPEPEPAAVPVEEHAPPPAQPEVEPSAPAASPTRVSLRVDIDFEAGEATVSLADDSDSVRLVHDGERWRLAQV